MTFKQWLARPRGDEMVKPDVKARTLFGWWKILSFQVEFEDAGECADASVSTHTAISSSNETG